MDTAMPINSLITPTAAEVATDAGMNQCVRIGANLRWSLQQDHGYIAHNAGLHGTAVELERGYTGSPQEFTAQRTFMGTPPATESAAYLPGRTLWSEET